MSLPGDAGKAASASRPEPQRIDQRFPRESRLTARRQYLTAYKAGRRVGSRSFTIFGVPNQMGHCRLGITVTRKVGSATRRNRVKRLMRDIFRRNRIRLRPNMDLVINAHRSIDVRDRRALEAEFLASFARLARRIER